MTATKWKTFLSFMLAICSVLFLLYQAMTYYSVGPAAKPIHRLIFTTADAAGISQQNLAKNFIQSMGDDVINAISDQSLNQTEKKQKLAKVLNRNFDMDTINRFTMGRYWKQMTSAQKREYAALYEQYIVAIYADKFSNYRGETLKVNESISTDTTDSVVYSYIIRPQEKNIPVNWHVRLKNGQYKIIDVSIENVSMIITQKADFASTIQRKGGDPSVIIDFLRRRLNKISG